MSETRQGKTDTGLWPEVEAQRAFGDAWRSDLTLTGNVRAALDRIESLEAALVAVLDRFSWGAKMEPPHWYPRPSSPATDKAINAANALLAAAPADKEGTGHE